MHVYMYTLAHGRHFLGGGGAEGALAPPHFSLCCAIVFGSASQFNWFVDH